MADEYLNNPSQTLAGLRQTLESQGYNVGYDDATGNVSVNNKIIPTTGLQMINDRYYGTPEQIKNIADNVNASSVAYNPQYGKQLLGIQNQIQNIQPYQSPYKGQMDFIQAQLLGRQFKYDSSKDTSFQNASKELSRNVMEQMNARGILNSTPTENQIQQGIGQLLPQYEQMAQDRFNQETNNLLNIANFLQQRDSDEYKRYTNGVQQLYDTANFISGLDDKSYSLYKDQVERDAAAQKAKFEQEKYAIEQERAMIKDAWERVKNLGYVDNEASLMLGVEVGTLSADVQKEIRDRQHELDKMARENEYKMQQSDIRFRQDVYVTQLEDENRMRLQQSQAENSRILKQMDIEAGIEKEERDAARKQSESGKLKVNDYADFIDNYYTQPQYDDNGKISGRAMTMQNKRDITGYLINLYQSGIDENIINSLAAKYEINLDEDGNIG